MCEFFVALGLQKNKAYCIQINNIKHLNYLKPSHLTKPSADIWTNQHWLVCWNKEQQLRCVLAKVIFQITLPFFFLSKWYWIINSVWTYLYTIYLWLFSGTWFAQNKQHCFHKNSIKHFDFSKSCRFAQTVSPSF